MKIIGAPQGLQDGLIHPLAEYSSSCLLTSADSAADLCTNVDGGVQHWVEAQFDARYLIPQASLVDQRYHRIQQPICPTR